MSKRIKFADDARWWLVKAEDDRFTVLTRQAAFQPKGTLVYTIIDRERGVRGPCNLIGQGYGDGTYDAAQCAEILAGLRLHVDREAWLANQDLKPGPINYPDHLDPEGIYPIEVSYRNNVPVKIDKETVA